MKSIKWYLSFLLIVILGVSNIFAQSKKKGDKDKPVWNYEIEAFGAGVQGTYQIKVWSYTKTPETVLDLAKKNAVHGIIFKGYVTKDRIQGQSALATDPNVEQEKADFFNEFFADGGKYLTYVTITNNGAILPDDRIKISKKEYKIGVVLSVNVADLRKTLEEAGIIKALGSE